MLPRKPSNFVRLPVLIPEQLRGTPAAVVTTDPAEESTLALLAAHMGSNLALPEFWGMHFPQCGVLISSAISGGSFRQRLQDAASCYDGRCWLLVEPIRARFPLPCSSGVGTPLDAPPDVPGFFSRELCCQYAHFCKDDQAWFLLWDTEETIEKKVALAKESGFLGYARG